MAGGRRFRPSGASSTGAAARPATPRRRSPVGSPIGRVRTRLSTLRIQLFILVLLGVLPALGLMLYSATAQRKEAIAGVQETALRLARLASSEHGQHLAGTEALLVALARMPEIRHPDNRPL